MEDDVFTLHWTEHSKIFSQAIANLRGKTGYTDATLACENQFFAVHKFVLSTCSDYFSNIFEHTPCMNPVIVINNIDYNDLEALLNFMYLGEIGVSEPQLQGILKAAEILNIKGLAALDVEKTLQNVNQNSGSRNVHQETQNAGQKGNQSQNLNETKNEIQTKVQTQNEEIRQESLNTSKNNETLNQRGNQEPGKIIQTQNTNINAPRKRKRQPPKKSTPKAKKLLAEKTQKSKKKKVALSSSTKKSPQTVSSLTGTLAKKSPQTGTLKIPKTVSSLPETFKSPKSKTPLRTPSTSRAVKSPVLSRFESLTGCSVVTQSPRGYTILKQLKNPVLFQTSDASTHTQNYSNTIQTQAHTQTYSQSQPLHSHTHTVNQSVQFQSIPLSRAQDTPVFKQVQTTQLPYTPQHSPQEEQILQTNTHNPQELKHKHTHSSTHTSTPQTQPNTSLTQRTNATQVYIRAHTSQTQLHASQTIQTQPHTIQTQPQLHTHTIQTQPQVHTHTIQTQPQLHTHTIQAQPHTAQTQSQSQSQSHIQAHIHKIQTQQLHSSLVQQSLSVGESQTFPISIVEHHPSRVVYADEGSSTGQSHSPQQTFLINSTGQISSENEGSNQVSVQEVFVMSPAAEHPSEAAPDTFPAEHISEDIKEEDQEEETILQVQPTDGEIPDILNSLVQMHTLYDSKDVQESEEMETYHPAGTNENFYEFSEDLAVPSSSQTDTQFQLTQSASIPTLPSKPKVPKRPIPCPKCSVPFNSRDSLTRHLKRHEQPYSCTECEYTTAVYREFLGHKKVHKKKECDYCSYVNECDYKLKRHIKRHEEKRNYLCKKCDFSGMTREQLREHNKSHK